MHTVYTHDPAAGPTINSHYKQANTWERTLRYTINSRASLERIWHWRETYAPTIYIYKQRILKHTVTWVIDLEPGHAHDTILAEHSAALTRIQ